MNRTIPDFLARIVAHKRRLSDFRPAGRDQLERRAAAVQRRDFAAALASPPPSIIAEIKRASPSRGALAPMADAASTARAYARGGAAALSVLTEPEHFAGSLDDLERARAATSLPVLRKDFTLDEYDIAEAAAHGADAVLLIAAILSARDLERLRQYAASFGMAALVEVHDRDELAAALDSGARIVGVNNRNLRTLQVQLETSLELAPHIPAGVLKVSESGIRSAADVRRLREAGFDAFLVGEHLMQASDPETALRALRS
ncbi:MAG: indole-3-glycerol phosphate synthase TrpC [Bryobacteraceae bacterium]|nr:indole-3-glycerol phosphate synthase TrpC [Bryobacteraceae bacterium]